MLAVCFIPILFLSHTSFGKETSIEEDLIEGNKTLSKHIDSLAEELDGFLSARRSPVKNNTTVSIIGFTESRETVKLTQTGHINVDLQLPSFEERWRIRVSSFDREDEFEGLQRNRTDGRPEEQKPGTSVAFNQKLGNIKATFRPRIEFKDPFVSSILLMFEHSQKWWFMTINTRLKLFAHSVDGAGQALSVDFEKALTRHIVFRFFNEQQYLDRLNLLATAQGPSLFEKLTDTMALAQTLSFNSLSRTVPERSIGYETDSYHLTSYQFIVTFSHQLYPKVFHYSVSPSLSFDKYRNFKGDAGILLRTELIF